MNVLTFDPLHLDELCNLCGLPIKQVSATLVMMELQGTDQAG
jgi:predicted Rossmann fold nucleotide-binding protein DprA/Smf involved in DNA uptake